MKKIVKVVMKDSKSVLEASQNVEFDDVMKAFFFMAHAFVCRYGVKKKYIRKSMKAFLAMGDDEREEALDYWEEMRHGND